MAREEKLKEELKIGEVNHASLNELQRKLVSLPRSEAIEAATRHAAELRVLLGKRASIRFEEPIGEKYRGYHERKRVNELAITRKTRMLREAVKKISESR